MRNLSRPASLDEYLAVERGRLVELARLVDLSPQQLCDIRKGRRVPSLAVALRLARATGLPIESFAGEVTK